MQAEMPDDEIEETTSSGESNEQYTTEEESEYSEDDPESNKRAKKPVSANLENYQDWQEQHKARQADNLRKFEQHKASMILQIIAQYSPHGKQSNDKTLQCEMN